MNPRVCNVTPNDDFTLSLEFRNGEQRRFDCKPYLEFGVFQELKELAYFRRVEVAGPTIAWPNEQDICPDTLYEESVPEAKADRPSTAA